MCVVLRDEKAECVVCRREGEVDVILGLVDSLVVGVVVVVW